MNQIATFITGKADVGECENIGGQCFLVLNIEIIRPPPAATHRRRLPLGGQEAFCMGQASMGILWREGWEGAVSGGSLLQRRGRMVHRFTNQSSLILWTNPGDPLKWHQCESLWVRKQRALPVWGSISNSRSLRSQLPLSSPLPLPLSCFSNTGS